MNCISLIRRSFGLTSILNNKLSRVPYPWKNQPQEDPNINLVDAFDDCINETNRELLLKLRIKESKARDNKRIQILKETPWPRNEYIPNVTQRIGLIGYKLGMIPHWDNKGKRRPFTLYQIMDNVALNYIPPTEVYNLFNTSRYYMKYSSDTPAWVKQQRWGLQFVGAVADDPAKFKSQYAGLFTKYNVNPRHKLGRFLISPDAVVQPGTELNVQHFKLGDYIDVTARSTNYGFEGVMYKNKFSGGPKSATKSHRRPGCLAPRVKILRGKKMPGVHGNRLRTIRGVQIARIDYKYGIIYVCGPTPGPVHSYAKLNDTWLRYRIDKLKDYPAMPTLYETDEEFINWTEHEEDILGWVHKFDDPSISYVENNVRAAEQSR